MNWLHDDSRAFGLCGKEGNDTLPGIEKLDGVCKLSVFGSGRYQRGIKDDSGRDREVKEGDFYLDFPGGNPKR